MAAIKTNNFMLASGTLMLAPFGQGAANKAFDLDPATHSVGMLKNLGTTEESSDTELRAGVRQLLVDSQKTGVNVTVSAEVYEFSAQNLFYSLSLARTPVTVKANLLAAQAVAAASTLNLAALAASASYSPAVAADLTAGTWLMLRGSVNNIDRTFITKVQTTATNLNAVAISPAIPTGFQFEIGDPVYMINQIPTGTQAAQDFFSAKLVATLVNEDKPIVAIYPKVKISKGFNVVFGEENYGSMPFEIKPYFMTTSDIGGDARLNLIGTQQLGMLFTGF